MVCACIDRPGRADYLVGAVSEVNRGVVGTRKWVRGSGCKRTGVVVTRSIAQAASYKQDKHHTTYRIKNIRFVWLNFCFVHGFHWVLNVWISLTIVPSLKCWCIECLFGCLTHTR